MVEAQPLRDQDPERLGGYRLLGRLGAGGQGVVYLGEAPDGSRVAVKTLSTEAAGAPEQRQRFVREAEAARQVASFCTAALLDAEFEADPPYIVSEFVDGPSLERLVRSNGPLPEGDLQRVAVATATALMAIHEAGIVHRDLKPANVLMGQGGARVIDFGVAQVSQGAGTLTNSSIGTPAYMAPEQISGAPVSPVTDVYAWGAVVAFAATGRAPFSGDTVPAILHRVLHGDPDLEGVPESLRLLVISALQKDPAQRPSSTDVLMTLIGRQEPPTDQEGTTRVMRAAAASASGPPTWQQTRVEPTTPATAAAAGPPTGAGPPGAPHGAGGPGPDGRRRPGARGALLAVGAVLLGVVLLGAGVLAGQLLFAPDGPLSADGASPTPSRQADQAGQPDSAEPEPSSPSDTPSSPPPAVPEFTKEYENDWEGVNDEGDLFRMDVSEGERSTTLEGEDTDCSFEIKLTRALEGGYEGTFEASNGEECTGGAGRGDAELGIREGFLLVQLTTSDGDQAQLRMQPEE